MQSKVRLIGVTQPRTDELNSAEELVAFTARVSNPSNQANALTAPKLLAYLVKNQHWSPLEMVHIVMEINTTRDIARQILRHRSFSFQEFSQRYADASQLGFEYREARLQDTKNRQNSLVNEDVELADVWQKYQALVIDSAKKAYTWALTNGIAKEQARAVLPEGMTKSRMYMSGSLRSWVHYCLLRTDVATQKEHREIADQCLNILKQEFPAIAEIISDNTVS